MAFAERWFDADPRMLDRVLALAADREPMVRLQLALSLGESHDARALPALVRVARSHGDEPWMAPAIRSRVSLVLACFDSRSARIRLPFSYSPRNSRTRSSSWSLIPFF